MARVKRGVAAAKRRKRLMKRAKGFYGSRSKLSGTAQEAVDKAGVYAYIGRKQRKRAKGHGDPTAVAASSASWLNT